MKQPHPIFNNSKLKITPVNQIIVDHREKNSLVIPELYAKRAPITFAQLEVGDYIIGDCIIERKTITDFASSIKNKRLFEQITQLEKHPRSLLIIEGLEEKHITKSTRINENGVRGVLLWIAKKNIPIIYTYSERDTASYLALLSRLPQEKSAVSRVQKNHKSVREELLFILQGFLGIGPIKSKKLLTSFKTISNIANASKEELKKCVGVAGEKVYETCRKVSEE